MFSDFYGRLAQLVEQLTLNQRVVGSSPAASTILKPSSEGFFFTIEESYVTEMHA